MVLLTKHALHGKRASADVGFMLHVSKTFFIERKLDIQLAPVLRNVSLVYS